MKRNVPFLLLVFALSTLFFVTCKKDDPKTDEPEEPPQVGTIPGFTWTPTGGSAFFSDSAKCIAAFNNIVAYKKGLSNSVDITLSGISTGNYSISPSLGNTLEFVIGTATYTGKSGTLAITGNTNAKLSGNFSTSLSGGTITSLSGLFIDIPIK